MNPAQHINEMKRILKCPPPEARFWDQSSAAERRYLLLSAEHPAGCVDDECRKRWCDLTARGRASAGRGYRNVMAWAGSVADRGEIVDL